MRCLSSGLTAVIISVYKVCCFYMIFHKARGALKIKPDYCKKRNGVCVCVVN
jgi:hypothetical protein